MTWRKPNWANHSQLDKQKLKLSLHQFFNIDSHCNFYHPFLDIFIRGNHHLKRLNHRYCLLELREKNKFLEQNIRIFFSHIRDLKTKKIKKSLVLVKEIPLIRLELFHLFNQQNLLIPNKKNFRLINNFYHIENPAYLEIFANYLTSNLRENNISPHFPFFYGTINCLYDKFSYYHSESDSSIELPALTQQYPNYIQVNNAPVQVLFQEVIPKTLSSFLKENDYQEEQWNSIVWQVLSALSIIVNRYQMTHNDLHIHNIMYEPTKEEFLYYQHPDKNRIYKIPTYGKIFKIIDFGRVCFTFNDKKYINQNFRHPNSAYGQYLDKSQYISHIKDAKSENLGVDSVFLIYNLLRKTNKLINDSFIKLLINSTKNKFQNTIDIKDVFDFDLYIDYTQNYSVQPDKILFNKYYDKYLFNPRKVKNYIVYKLR